MISLIVTPFFLLNNIIRYLFALRMAKPEPGIVAMDAPIGSEPPPVGSGSLKFKLIYGTIVCCVALGALAYHNVAFLEKHAPALNAKLHSGEITDEADAEYSLTKLFDNVAELGADLKSKDWDGMRAELLSRKPHLFGINEQNDSNTNA